MPRILVQLSSLKFASLEHGIRSWFVDKLLAQLPVGLTTVILIPFAGEINALYLVLVVHRQF
jgi:hypothetical protein